MFDEMYFLFDINNSIANNVNSSGNVKSSSDPAQSIRTKPVLNDDGNFINQSYVVTSGDAKNFIKNSINAPYQSTKKNPYMQLLDHFDGVNSSKSLKLKSSDLAYLRDIGVLPINRLMILRRYPIGTVVPRDLNELNIEPISTIVGWVKNDSDFLSFSFNEVWRTQGSSEMLHVLLNDMISKEFGINMNEIMPIPGWSVGLVFGFLHNMGLTEYNKTNIPLGDPNVLKESITRPHEEFGLSSDFSFSLETVYEQKFIGDIDLTVSYMDILLNTLLMGTSNIKYIGKAGNKILNDLRAANNNPTNPSGWINLISSVMKGFVDAIGKTLEKAEEKLKDLQKSTPKKDDKPDNTQENTQNNEQNKNNKSESEKLKASQEKLAMLDMLTDKNSLLGGLVQSILASTVAKYVWPLRGSIAMLTGEAATPWHLTIGNPYSPFLSMNNIHVTDVSCVAKGDMMYNDIPKYLEVKVSMKQGRNMGGNEIYSMFGIEYQRIYKKSK